MNFLISPPDLRDAPANTILLDARFRLSDPAAGRRLFEGEHLPGARFIDLDTELSGPKTGKNGRHPLPSRAQLKEVFGRLGIAPETKVVVYDDGDHSGATRAWTLLRWMGHENVKVLDGGLAGWKEAELPTEKGAPSPSSPVDFQERASLVSLLSKEQLPGRRLVDARAPERYRGEVEPLDPQAGHIPGAENLFYKSVLGEDGRFLPSPKLPREESVYYCGSGVTGSVLLFAAENAGLKHHLYPGSWSEWCADPSAPVETGLYRRGVVAVFQNEAGEVLLFQRNDKSRDWQFPQGGLEGDETPVEGLRREIREEVGVERFERIREGRETSFYDWPEGKARKKGQKGQRHFWFLCRLDEEPNFLASDGSFLKCKWVSPAEALDRVIDWKKDAYRTGLAALGLL